jgi:hypothetical protein
MHKHLRAGPDHHVLQQAVVGREVHGEETRRSLESQDLRLGPDKICRCTNVSGVAVEESDPKHGITGLEVLYFMTNLFHPARVLEARCDRPAPKAACGFVYAPSDADICVVHSDSLGADQDFAGARFRDRMRLELELLVTARFVYHHFVHGLKACHPNSGVQPVTERALKVRARPWCIEVGRGGATG